MGEGKTILKTKKYKFEGFKGHGCLEGRVIYIDNEKLACFDGQIQKTDKTGNILLGKGCLEYKSKLYTQVSIRGLIEENYLASEGEIIFNNSIIVEGQFTKQEQIDLITKIRVTQSNMLQIKMFENKRIKIDQMEFVINKMDDKLITGKIDNPAFTYDGQFLSFPPYQFNGQGTAIQKQTGIQIKCQNWVNGIKDGETTITYNTPTQDNIIQQVSIYKDNVLFKTISTTYTDKKITINSDGTIRFERKNEPGYYIGKELINFKINGTFKYYHEDIIETNVYKDDVIIQKLNYEDDEKFVTLNNDLGFIKYKNQKMTYDGQVNSQNQPDGQGILTIDETTYDGLFKNGNKHGNFLVSNKKFISQDKYKNDVLVQHFWKYEIDEKLYTRYDKNRIKYTFQGFIDEDYLPDGEGILIQKDKQYSCVMESGSLVSKKFIGIVTGSKLDKDVTYNPSASTIQELGNDDSTPVSIKEISLVNSKVVKTKMSQSSSQRSFRDSRNNGSDQSSMFLQNANTDREKNNVLPLIAVQQGIDSSTETEKKINESLIISQIEQSNNDIIVANRNDSQEIRVSNKSIKMIDNGDSITYFDSNDRGRIVTKNNRNLIYKGQIDAYGNANGRGFMYFDDNTFIDAIFSQNEIVTVLNKGRI